MTNKKCIHCGKEIVITTKCKYKGKIYVYKNPGNSNSKFCSIDCYHSYAKGRKLTGKALKNAQTTIKKAVCARKNNPIVRKKWITKMKKVTTGYKNHRWIKDRSKLVNTDGRNSYKYIEWRKKVIIRDGFKCLMNDKHCDNKLEVHHILSWRDYPELRYDVDNGITLCHVHHPRKEVDEKKLVKTFQKLIK